MTGVVGMFIPFGSTMDLIYAIGGTLIFSGYIVYDTYMINRRLSPDEFIMGAISLYLEYVFLWSVREWTVTDLLLLYSFINLCKCGVQLPMVIVILTLSPISVLSILRLLNNIQDR